MFKYSIALVCLSYLIYKIYEDYSEIKLYRILNEDIYLQLKWDHGVVTKNECKTRTFETTVLFDLLEIIEVVYSYLYVVVLLGISGTMDILVLILMELLSQDFLFQ